MQKAVLLASSAIVAVLAQSAARADTANPQGIETVTVTAEKRVEPLLNVPVPVTVVDPSSLVSNGQPNLKDWYTSVPGLSFSPQGRENNAFNLSIRGITTGGATNPTVSVLIDDMPFGSSTLGPGGIKPDIDPGDLERIEVLRGPQGTLYGDNSMGGLVKSVTKDPSTDGYSGRLEVGTEYIQNGDGPGYDVRGAVNVPLDDETALRVSGYTTQDPGYIDNPVYHIRGVNRDNADGLRASVLWTPQSNVSLKLR